MVKSIQYKLIVVYILLLLCVFTVLGVLLMSALESYYLEEFKQGIKSHGQLLSNYVSNHLYDAADVQTLNTLVKDFSHPIPMADIYIVSNQGIMISTSREKQSFSTTKTVQREVVKFMSGSPSEGIRDNPETGYRNYFYAVPIVQGQMELGTVYIVSSLEKVEKTLGRFRNLMIAGGTVTILLASALGFMVAKTIIQPIKDITQKAEALAQGDYDVKINIKAEDEIGQLGKMFNYLAEKLQQSIGEISEQNTKTEAILQNLTDGVVAFNEDGQVVHQNSLTEKLLGTKDNQQLKNILFQYMYDFQDTVSSKEILTAQGEINDKSLLFNYVPFSSSKGNVGLIVVIKDITEREHLEFMRRQFVADVSHELRTPLTSIKSYVEALLNDGMEDEELSRKFLKVVEEETDRMVRMVKDLLIMTRLDYNKENWQLVEIDLQELVESVLTSIQLQAKDKGQQISLKYDFSVLNVKGDRDKLQQLFINLLANSIKYTQEGGSIEVGLKQADDESIEISISDNGIGIPKEDLPRVFDRFYRVDKARSREMGGTGLGLAIAKQIVERHCGTITIDSEEGKGTIVRVVLPIRKKA